MTATWGQFNLLVDEFLVDASRAFVRLAGATGTATAQLLADRGERVRLVTRSGGGPEHPAIERVAADASDADALSRLAEGASP